MYSLVKEGIDLCRLVPPFLFPEGIALLTFLLPMFTKHFAKAKLLIPSFLQLTPPLYFFIRLVRGGGRGHPQSVGGNIQTIKIPRVQFK